MGVSGVGKSTIGKLLAQELSIPFFDGDDYHPKENIAKMNAGIALTDDDRRPWLHALNMLAHEQIQKGSCVIACSSLKNSYRARLKKNIDAHVKFVFLNGTFELIKERIEKRAHFMPVSLLASQFDTLEKPIDSITLDIRLAPHEIVEQLKVQLFEQSEIGVIGLGVMGTSLARNLAAQNFQLSIFNRHVSGKEEDIAVSAVKKYPELSNARPYDDLATFINSLRRPRRVLLMVNAGKPVDSVLENLIPLMSENDVVIDGGNSHFEDTKRRKLLLDAHRIHFIGAGVSGGEQGALNGPSIMPSGDKIGYELAGPFLEAIAARDVNENPCCTYIGPDGSGHFVKMIHNGIEYVEMQLLAEVYAILKNSGKNPDAVALELENWQRNANSFLLEITIDILRKKEGDEWLIDKILDTSGNKGTGNWATVAAAQLGMPSTLIASALFARYISSFKEYREQLSSIYKSKATAQSIDEHELLSAYQFARFINHVQGFQLIEHMSDSHNWNLNLSEIARIWTNGCIIRSDLMQEFVDHLKNSENVLFNEALKERLSGQFMSAKKIVAQCILDEISIPCLSESIHYFNALKTAKSSANLIQAQRDYFGAHTYQRIDDHTGKSYHTNWNNPYQK